MCGQGAKKEPHHKRTESGGEHFSCVSGIVCVCVYASMRAVLCL